MTVCIFLPKAHCASFGSPRSRLVTSSNLGVEWSLVHLRRKPQRSKGVGWSGLALGLGAWVQPNLASSTLRGAGARENGLRKVEGQLKGERQWTGDAEMDVGHGNVIGGSMDARLAPLAKRLRGICSALHTDRFEPNLNTNLHPNC